MSWSTQTLLELGGLVILLLVGLIAGTITRRRHLDSLAERERDYADVAVSDLRSFVRGRPARLAPRLVTSEVVLANDFLGTWLGALRQWFGGELLAYAELVERARREALLRLQERARTEGYTALANLRIESADLGGAEARRGARVVAVVACATAYVADPDPARRYVGGIRVTDE